MATQWGIYLPHYKTTHRKLESLGFETVSLENAIGCSTARLCQLVRRLLVLLVKVLLDDLTISQIGEATSPLPNKWHTNSIRDCFSIGQWDEALTRLLLGKNLNLDKRKPNILTDKEIKIH